MTGLVLGLFTTCLAIYAVVWWYLGEIKEELKAINRYLKDRSDKEEGE